VRGSANDRLGRLITSEHSAHPATQSSVAILAQIGAIIRYGIANPEVRTKLRAALRDALVEARRGALHIRRAVPGLQAGSRPMTAVDTPKNFDGRPELRELVAEQFGFLLLHAENGQRYAEAGDDRGLEYSVRQVIARAKFVGETYADIIKEPERLAARESEAA
jgi:hypothetical protein